MKNEPQVIKPVGIDEPIEDARLAHLSPREQEVVAVLTAWEKEKAAAKAILNDPSNKMEHSIAVLVYKDKVRQAAIARISALAEIEAGGKG